jgi:putative NADPH-quinone reductase
MTAATRADRLCLVAAFALTFAWFLVFAQFRPDYLVDESGHLSIVYHFLEGKPGWPEHMTMLPGYHYIVVALWKLHPPCSLLTLARFVSAITALLTLAAFALAWKKFHGRPGGAATLLLALLPILQPFTGLAYSDVPALAFVVLAVAAHFANRRFAAALLFAVATLIRQTNLAWAGFLIAWEFLRPDAPRREFLQRTRWLLALLALAAAAVFLAGRLTPGTDTGTGLGMNIATLHFAGVLVLVLGLPLWLAHAPAAFRSWVDAARARPALTLGLTALTAGTAAALALTFQNPHAWNREFFWDDGKFTLLRNWPLILIDTHPWLRAASGLNVVLMAAALALTFARQPHRRELWLALAFGALLPFTNNLVEPRYFITGAVFVLFFLELPPADTRRLAVWWFVLCAIHAPFIARGVSLW